jgi:hypothetical protein
MDNNRSLRVKQLENLWLGMRTMFRQVVAIPVLMAVVVLAVIVATLGVEAASVALGGTHKAATIYGFSVSYAHSFRSG